VEKKRALAEKQAAAAAINAAAADAYSDAADADRAADADLNGRIDDIIDDFEEIDPNMDVDDDYS
jgi:hypothetical protein